MQITPVLYILDGKCVSLYKGDFHQKEIYPKKPQNYAKEYASQGARRILLVDLNASEESKLVNKKIVSEIASISALEVQYTGGLRSMTDIDESFQNLEVKKVIIGIRGLTILPLAIKKYGADNVYCGVKAQGKNIVSENLDKPYEVFDFAQELKDLNVENFFYHDIFSEGTLIHPNYDEVERIIKTTDLNVYIGGGISKIKHLNLLRKIGVKGAYIGRALIEGTLKLKDLSIFEALN